MLPRLGDVISVAAPLSDLIIVLQALIYSAKFSMRMRGGEDSDDEADAMPPAEGLAVAGPDLGLEIAQASAELGIYRPRAAGPEPEPAMHHAPGQRKLADAAGAQEGPPPRRGTGAWLRANRDKPITPGHHVTVVQACYWLAIMKNEHRVTDEVVDRVCAMMHHLILPKGNLYPSSYHMVKAVLGVESSAACVQHICDKCWSVFPPMETSEYQANSDAVCTNKGCGHPRFNVTESGTAQPRRSMYHFDVRETVLDLMDPLFGQLDDYKAQRMLNFENSCSFWASPAGRLIDQSTGYKFSRPAADEIAIPFSLGAPRLCLCHYVCMARPLEGSCIAEYLYGSPVACCPCML